MVKPSCSKEDTCCIAKHEKCQRGLETSTWEWTKRRHRRNNTKIYKFYCKHKDNNYKAWIRGVGSLT